MRKHYTKPVEKGFGFGITSGVITTLGMIVGLDSATHHTGTIVGGIIAIAVADAFSDSLGMHISEESQKESKYKDIWTATISTFIAKFFLALSFIIPFVFLDLLNAVYVSIIWGMSVLIIYNYRLAKLNNKNPFDVITEHLIIAVIVLLITSHIGEIIAFLF